MRTARLLPGGVPGPRGGVCFLGKGGGVPGLGGCLLPGGVIGPGMVSQHALRQTPPLWTESQTRVKT